MEKINLKNALKSLKEQNKDKKYIKYSEVIKEKIKENDIKPKSLVRDFSEFEKEREEWNKTRNEKLNRDQEKKLSEQNKKDIKQNEYKEKEDSERRIFKWYSAQ